MYRMKNETENTTYNLTQTEYEVLKHLINGENNMTIANNMFVSVNTIKIHMKNIFRKLEVPNRTKAVLKSIKCNIINLT